MDQPLILLIRQLPAALITALQQFGEVRVLDAAASEIPAGQVLVSTAVDPVPAALIERLPATFKLIANIGVGFDNIDLNTATQRGIAVSNTPVVTEDTADLVMALMLATCRRLSASERYLRDGNWAAGASQLGQRGHGKTLGIVGLGAIGQAVARRAKGFDMTILYHGPHRDQKAETELGATYCANLAELLGQADIVSLNCTLNAETRHLLNAQTLAQLKPGAVLINAGRGPLIDEQALVAALRSGHLGAAGLDVFEFEPSVTPELLSFDNVTLLPHIGSATGECRSDMARRVCANILHFLQRGAPLDRCN